jgi:hypothetical protein
MTEKVSTVYGLTISSAFVLYGRITVLKMSKLPITTEDEGEQDGAHT